MNPRAFSRVTRAIRPTQRSLALRISAQRRFASSDSESQPPFNISRFYKTFTRPIAKVLLMAFFTYQLAYWGWTKLEHDEIMAEREAYICELEEEIYELTGTPVGSVATKLKELEASQENISEDRMLYYQTQLMELEKRNEKLLKAVAQSQLGPEGWNGGKPADEEKKKSSSWWKVW